MDKYVVEKVIGEGTYGIVYKAKEKYVSLFSRTIKFVCAHFVRASPGNW